jgi:site-specific DNA-methyltransferase (adenine-specific)
MREEIIGDCRLILGDCAEILPTLPQADFCITDPPYGIGKDGQKRTTGGNGGRKAYDFMGWDGERPSAALMTSVVNAGRECVIWGGNYFADLLPATGKRINQSDGELAWTSLPGALRIFTLNRVELMADGAEHPTQKPVRLMEWTLAQVSAQGTVIDPFMGSGSTGVACVVRGCSFVGVEREQSYFDVACRRIETAYRQPRMFHETPAKPVQETLAL